MSSYRTIKPKNGNPGKTATDVHITTFDPVRPPADTSKAPKLNVKGVDGKAPGDPSASYQLDGDGSNTIDISDINVGTGGSINLRLQSDVDPFPPVWVQWTPKELFGVGTAEQIAQATTIPNPGSSALATLVQIIELATRARDIAIIPQD